jgi:hypothetical protein
MTLAIIGVGVSRFPTMTFIESVTRPSSNMKSRCDATSTTANRQAWRSRGFREDGIDRGGPRQLVGAIEHAPRWRANDLDVAHPRRRHQPVGVEEGGRSPELRPTDRLLKSGGEARAVGQAVNRRTLQDRQEPRRRIALRAGAKPDRRVSATFVKADDGS